MKKIVALVLCLVLALSLCTVAFGAEPTEAAATYYNQDVSDGKEVKVEYFKASDYEAGEENWIEFYKSQYGYYVAGSDDALYTADGKATGIKLDKDSVTPAEKLIYEYKVDKTNIDTKWSCTTDEVKADYSVIDEDGETRYYLEADAYGTGVTNLLLNGKIVYGEEVTQWVIDAQHLLIVKKDGPEKVEGKLGVYVAKCAACQKTFEISEHNVNGAGYKYTSKYTAWNAAEFNVAIPAGYEKFDVADWYVLTGATTGSTEAGTTVESAKTFDAGIAMYAGLALASVAGSAVVIGKKKEF